MKMSTKDKCKTLGIEDDKWGSGGSRYCNYRRTARKKLLYYVIHVLGYKQHGLKINKAIEIFVNHYKLKPTYPLELWFVKLYMSNESAIIKRNEDSFYSSPEWKRLRKKVIDLYGTTCMKCRGNLGDTVVDHIKPRSKFPKLELEVTNLQILCNICNIIKSDRFYNDYRPVGDLVSRTQPT